jgi:hypothetical protein
VNRRLVQSEAAVVALAVSELSKTGSPEDIEKMLGIEFAYADGRYPSDLEDSTPEDGDWSWEDQPVDFTTYRYGEAPYFPATYPALVLYSFEEGYDRGGKVETRVLLYVERQEFTEGASQ